MDGDCVAGVVPVPAGVQSGVGRGGVGHVQAAPDVARGGIALHADTGERHYEQQRYNGNLRLNLP